MRVVSVATWNVNSIKSRLHQLLPWLREAAPDIVLLQETKTVDESFPAMEIEDLGYNIAIHGQKTYNGVAILSKFPLEDITRGLPALSVDDTADEQARYIEAVVNLPGQAMRVASVYVPNGQEVGSDKFAYKLAFLARLRAHAARLLALEEILVLGGDYNVAPAAMDVYDAQKLEGTVCFHPDERAALRSITHLGLYDAFRLKHPEAKNFSWWDYRENAHARDHGLRIDHLLLSPQAADRLTESEISHALRGEEKPSDHVPVVAWFSI